MGAQIVRQPDGRLAVFSSVVDSWIVYDATGDELVEYFATEAAEEARRQARRAIDAVERGDARAVYFQFAHTFEEADEIAGRHGGTLADVRAGKERS